MVAKKSTTSRNRAFIWDKTYIGLTIQEATVSEVVKLLAGGADIELKDDGGRTPAMIAAHHGRDDILRKLINLGANIHAKDNYHVTPLMHATSWGRENCALTLLAAGAKVQGENNQGRSAAMLAKRSGHRDLAELLERIANTQAEATQLHAAISCPSSPRAAPKPRI